MPRLPWALHLLHPPLSLLCIGSVDELKGKRVGIFVDGPKEERAVKLCAASLAHSTAPAFCAIHDVAKNTRIAARKRANMCAPTPSCS